MAKEKEPKKKERRPSALKRDLQNEKSRLRNKIFKSRVKTAIRDLNENLTEGENSQERLNQVYSLMDKGVKKGIFTINKASRTKSRLAAKAAPSA